MIQVFTNFHLHQFVIMLFRKNRPDSKHVRMNFDLDIIVCKIVRRGVDLAPVVDELPLLTA